MTVIDIPPIGPLPRSRAQKVGRERRLRSFNKRLPYRLIIVPDPVLKDEARKYDGEISDNEFLLNTLWQLWTEGRATEVRCDFHRRFNINRAGGREPVDEPVQHIMAQTAGYKPVAVNITDLCTIMEEPGEGLYTIINIGTDRLGYNTTYTLEEFGHRSSGEA